MTIFAIIKQPGENAEKLEPAIAEAFRARYPLGSDAWLVSTTGTAQEVSDRLGVTDGTNGAAVVIEMASYFGRANPAIWTWIKANWEAKVG